MGKNRGTVSHCTSAATLTITDATNSNYIGGICGENDKGTLSDNLAIGTLVPAIILANDADNRTTINDADGYLADVTLADRTLYKDGDWNTICLPFNVTLDASPLAGATARALKEASISGTTLSLTFDEAVEELVAGTPYIKKNPRVAGIPSISLSFRECRG